ILEKCIKNRKGNIACSSGSECQRPFNILNNIKIGHDSVKYGATYNQELDPGPFLDHVVGLFMCSVYKSYHDESIRYAIYNILDGTVDQSFFGTFKQCVAELYNLYAEQ